MPGGIVGLNKKENQTPKALDPCHNMWMSISWETKFGLFKFRASIESVQVTIGLLDRDHVGMLAWMNIMASMWLNSSPSYHVISPIYHIIDESISSSFPNNFFNN